MSAGRTHEVVTFSSRDHTFVVLGHGFGNSQVDLNFKKNKDAGQILSIGEIIVSFDHMRDIS